jgi:hypothetical protein
MGKIFRLLSVFFLAFFSGLVSGQEEARISGWTILSNSLEDDINTIKAAKAYNINHLQLSHDIMMDLRDIRDPERLQMVNDLVKAAHQEGIKEVLAWDHALYDLKYYPEKFRTGPKGTIDLDNTDFWEWFRQDYREMLKLVPEINGLVLTFIETGARAENQFSSKLKTGPEKIAAVVDAVASVVCDESGRQLYIRTFAYTHAEYENTIGCIGLIRNQKVRLMMKETPHDFFLTHPNDMYAGTINRPTIMEFDAGNEFNGQGVIANTWPEYIIKRWSDLIKRPHVIGYVARTDRYGDTHIVGTPNEILLYTLKRFTEDNSVTPDIIYNEFISSKYGAVALQYLKPAFMKAYGIVTSTLYTLGTNVANHSKMDYDPYKSSYGRHVSGKWIDPPVVMVKHDVNREFNYWTDVIEHIAPARYKLPDAGLAVEAPFVVKNNWVTPVEKMDEEYLKYIVTEKKYGVRQAEEALKLVMHAKNTLNVTDYQQLYDLFSRTLLTARIYEATAKSYYGYRVWARGGTFQSDYLKKVMSESLADMLKIADEIDNYKGSVPKGQWNWRDDAETARKYHRLITETGWKEYGNVIFKLK